MHLKVLKIAKNKVNVSRKDIEMELKLSKSTVTLILNRLLEEGKIQQEGKTRNTKYHIKQGYKDKINNLTAQKSKNF